MAVLFQMYQCQCVEASVAIKTMRRSTDVPVTCGQVRQVRETGLPRFIKMTKENCETLDSFNTNNWHFHRCS